MSLKARLQRLELMAQRRVRVSNHGNTLECLAYLYYVDCLAPDDIAIYPGLREYLDNPRPPDPKSKTMLDLILTDDGCTDPSEILF